MDRYELIKEKQVKDYNGDMVGYYMYHDKDNDEYFFMFEDSEPNPDWADWTCDSRDEAEEWFDDYSGFEEDDDYDDPFDDEEDIKLTSDDLNAGQWYESLKEDRNATPKIDDYVYIVSNIHNTPRRFGILTSIDKKSQTGVVENENNSWYDVPLNQIIKADLDNESLKEAYFSSSNIFDKAEELRDLLQDFLNDLSQTDGIEKYINEDDIAVLAEADDVLKYINDNTNESLRESRLNEVKDIPNPYIYDGTAIPNNIKKYIEKVKIRDGVTSIGNYAFYGCANLTSITIPDSVTSIGNNAFGLCNSLTNITIPNSVTSIGDFAFYYCTYLTSITIPDSVTSIGDLAFDGCYSLKHISIPDSVTSIGDWAFSDCNSLTSITIPDSITSISDWAFSGCHSLASVTIPNSVTFIGNGAFYNCTNLTDVYYAGSKEDWDKIRIGTDNKRLLNANIHFNSSKNESLKEDLIQSDSEEAFKKNVATEIKAGKPREQALAIAYSVKRKNKNKKKNESLQDEDGWGEEIREMTYNTLENISSLQYEIEKTVRGAYTGVKTADELADYFDEYSFQMGQIADDLRNNADRLDENKCKRNKCLNKKRGK